MSTLATVPGGCGRSKTLRSTRSTSRRRCSSCGAGTQLSPPRFDPRAHRRGDPRAPEPVMPLPRVQPVVPTRRKESFDDPDWLFDLKYDGVRALLYIEQGRGRLISRNGNSLTRFAVLATQIAFMLASPPTRPAGRNSTTAARHADTSLCGVRSAVALRQKRVESIHNVAILYKVQSKQSPHCRYSPRIGRVPKTPTISGDELRARVDRLGSTYGKAAAQLGLTRDGLNKQCAGLAR